MKKLGQNKTVLINNWHMVALLLLMAMVIQKNTIGRIVVISLAFLVWQFPYLFGDI